MTSAAAATSAEADGARRDDRRAATRTCVVSRRELPVAELIRFVVAPDGTVVPDLKRRLPGRGVWVEARRPAVEAAVKRKLFARGLKAQVKVPPDLAERVEALLAEAAAQGFALANKAGRMVAGFAKVEAELAKGRVVALVHAADAAPDGVRKLEAAVRRLGQDGKVTVLAPLDGRHLDLALGRENVVHAALVAGPGSEGFLVRALELQRYRDISLTAEGTEAADAASGDDAADHSAGTDTE